MIWGVRLARGRPARRLAAAVVAACCGLPVSGCGLFGSGTEIATPSVMTLTGGEFARGVIPPRFTCHVRHATSPPMGWTGWPAGTKSIALVVDDSSAPITPYVYWIVFNISPTTSDILEGQLPPGARQARNSAGTAGYQPPCPDPGGHTYRFTVYALKSVIDLPAGAPLQSAWRAIAAAAIGRGRMTASARS
jgi:Raf kinase inhibitor-like YbhB/YbcL family protein